MPCKPNWAIGEDRRCAIPVDDESVLHRENHYFADDEPVQIVSTYLRWDEAQGTPLTQPHTGKDGEQTAYFPGGSGSHVCPTR